MVRVQSGCDLASCFRRLRRASVDPGRGGGMGFIGAPHLRQSVSVVVVVFMLFRVVQSRFIKQRPVSGVECFLS